MVVPTDGRIDGWTDGRMDGWMDGSMDGWTDGLMDGLFCCFIYIEDTTHRE